MPHRLAASTIALVDATGAPRAGQPVEVRQISHDFLFGNILFDLINFVLGCSDDESRDQAQLAAWCDLFNFGTLPFYWRTFEQTEGSPNTDALHNAARKFRDLGIKLKGHPLAWHTMAPRWLLGRPPADVEKLLQGRITREVSGFAGLIDTWDAINELVIMPVFAAEDNAITPLCLA